MNELSQSEVEILQMKAEGRSHATIAEARQRSYHTIKVQCDSIIKKLGAENMYHAIYLACRRGILQ